jgi:hypothetical protein
MYLLLCQGSLRPNPRTVDGGVGAVLATIGARLMWYDGQ